MTATEPRRLCVLLGEDDPGDVVITTEALDRTQLVHEVLAEVKPDPDLRTRPVVVLSTSEAEEDVIRSYEFHANMSEPIDFETFVKLVRQIDDFFGSVVRLPRTRP